MGLSSDPAVATTPVSFAERCSRANTGARKHRGLSPAAIPALLLTLFIGSPLTAQNVEVRLSVKRVLDQQTTPPTSSWTGVDIQNSVSAVNSIFRRLANVEFVLSEPNGYIDIVDPQSPSSWFDVDFLQTHAMEAWAESNPVLSGWRTDAVNVYLVNSIVNPNGLTCGLGSLPCSGGRNDIIFLVGCNGPALGLAHELGHYLDLRHTHANHESATCDCQGGSHYADCVGDTRNDADPRLASGPNGIDLARHFQNLQALSYSQSDEDLLRYNVMSYHGPTTEAEATLSAGQVRRLLASLFYYRSAQIQSAPPMALTPFGPACYGSTGEPALEAAPASEPRVNTNFDLDLSGLPPSGDVFGLLGFRPQSPAIPLDIIGMTDCRLYFNIVLTERLTNNSGSATWRLRVPDDQTLVGLRFLVQGFVADATANWFGAVLTNAGEAVIRPEHVPTMVPIAPGSFQMGSTQGYPNEQPVHTVTITRPFWIGKYEVTQAEYQALMGTNPSWFAGPNRPVETVSWNDAMAYCAALTAREQAAGRLPSGYQYRLPTEAEWEYCCRAGTTTEWNVGSSLSCAQANFYGVPGGGPCVGQTTDVGSYPANAWGLHDTHGNVWEWCLDAWDGSSNYPTGPVSDPYVTSGPSRVYRGGSWDLIAGGCRSASRRGLNPVNRYYYFGFRVVLAPVLVP